MQSSETASRSQQQQQGDTGADVCRGPAETSSKLQAGSCLGRDARCKAEGRAFRRSVSSGLRVPVRKTRLELEPRDKGRTVLLDETHDK